MTSPHHHVTHGDSERPPTPPPRDVSVPSSQATTAAAVGSRSCPTCHVTFDEGRRRRLIDACGHERCYSCMFSDERCPLCDVTPTAGEMIDACSHERCYGCVFSHELCDVTPAAGEMIEACSHERCYSCMFSNERCPLCDDTPAAGEMSFLWKPSHEFGV